MRADYYNETKGCPDGPSSQGGDQGVYDGYAGSGIKNWGGEVRLLNDDEVLANMKDPTDILQKF